MANFRYALRDTFRLILRHWGLSFLTLITAVALFFLLGSSGLFSLNLKNLVAEVENDLVINVFIKAGEDASGLVEVLQDVDYITDLKVISPEKGLEILRAKLGSQARAVTLLGENPLPWNVQIQVIKADFVTPLVRDLMSFPSVEEVVYAGQLAEKLSLASLVMNRVSIAVLVLAITITALVLYNTVNISIYAKRGEIEIMLLVGATNTSIALPFVLQGMLLSTFGALVSVILLAGAYQYISVMLAGTLSFLVLIADRVLLMRFYIILVGTGMTLGWLCSWFAVHRYIAEASWPD